MYDVDWSPPHSESRTILIMIQYTKNQNLLCTLVPVNPQPQPANVLIVLRTD